MKVKYSIFYVSVLLLSINQLFAQNLSVGLYHTQYLCKDGRAMSWGFDCDGRRGHTGPTYYPGYVNISVGLKRSLQVAIIHFIWIHWVGFGQVERIMLAKLELAFQVRRLK